MKKCFAGREDRTREHPHTGGRASDRATAPGKQGIKFTALEMTL